MQLIHIINTLRKTFNIHDDYISTHKLVFHGIINSATGINTLEVWKIIIFAINIKGNTHKIPNILVHVITLCLCNGYLEVWKIYFTTILRH